MPRPEVVQSSPETIDEKIGSRGCAIERLPQSEKSTAVPPCTSEYLAFYWFGAAGRHITCGRFPETAQCLNPLVSAPHGKAPCVQWFAAPRSSPGSPA